MAWDCCILFRVAPSRPGTWRVISPVAIIYLSWAGEALSVIAIIDKLICGINAISFYATLFVDYHFNKNHPTCVVYFCDIYCAEVAFNKSMSVFLK